MNEQVSFTAARADIDEAVAVGDLGYVRGTFHATVQPRAGGPAMTDANKFILIWRRQPDGSWKIARDIWSSNAPPPPPAGS
jgi:ketosteroid isomerase-like protein